MRWGARRWRRCHRITFDEFEIQLGEKRTLCRHMAREFVAMADGAYARTCHSVHPTALDTFDAILCKPFEWGLPQLAVTIRVGVGRCCSRYVRPRARPGLSLLEVIHDLKTIVICHIENI